ncbi:MULTISPECIES: IS5 family transposase [Gammaproteobacteria]|uniref:IS5 family transposase n=1 Tax=Gammaproteobacteria TaxID=1236 RepID=UPI003A94FFB5
MGQAKHPIRNWADYNRALINRASLRFWMDKAAIANWYCTQHHGKRGRSFEYSDTAIETALMLKALFKLPLRALEGFINSLFQLMKLPLTSPSYSCISKRAKTVNITYRLPNRGPVTHLVIDATGLKVFGEGEWKQRKYGKEQRRVWRKLHLAVDTQTHEAIAAEVSLESVGDSEVLPGLLNPLRRHIHQVNADGAYDSKACHRLLQEKGAKANIPPRKTADFCEEGHPRNDAVAALKAGQLAEWKRESGYHQQSKAETAMSRYKQLISAKLSLRNYNGQVVEALAGVKVMNKMLTLGIPVRQAVS